jgi:hypothetical protein
MSSDATFRQFDRTRYPSVSVTILNGSSAADRAALLATATVRFPDY